MPKIKYVDHRFNTESRNVITFCNNIIAEYERQGFTLTLRQLYYQCVSRDFIPNKDASYKRLGDIVNDARLAGLIDWNAIEDRTRFVRSMAHWEDPAEIVGSCASQFRVDLWRGQPYRPEVWIEKDALIGVFEGVCNEFDVPHFSCRGYTSQSEMWGAAQRFVRTRRGGQTPVIFHFGDHDPSGVDMTRDIIDRITLFSGGLQLERLALTMDQVDQYKPPPNPAKITDSRAAGYIREFGNESWELDALSPTVLAGLVRASITGLIDQDVWDDRQRLIDEGRDHLSAVSDKWDRIKEMIDADEIQ